MSITRAKLIKYLNTLLKPEDFDDYGPNGLQIEGKDTISKIAFAVSASRDAIEKAAKENADCLIVHHGLFWKFTGAKPIIGPFHKRVAPLIQNDINLIGYHLPLDAHLEVGNNAAIAKLLRVTNIKPFGEYKGQNIGVKGTFKTNKTVKKLKQELKTILKHPIWVSSFDEKSPIKSIGIISGGADSEFQQAADDKLDAYVTGEMSEHVWHEAKEAGIHMFAGGHNATEQFGVQNLMKKIKKEFKVNCFFIPSKNPA